MEGRPPPIDGFAPNLSHHVREASRGYRDFLLASETDFAGLTTIREGQIEFPHLHRKTSKGTAKAGVLPDFEQNNLASLTDIVYNEPNCANLGYIPSVTSCMECQASLANGRAFQE